MLMTRTTLALVLCATLAVACDTRGRAYGDPNSIIAVMSPELWQGLADDVYAELEPTIMTVRDEKAFTVTYQAPYAEYWSDLRRFRQMLVVGSLSDAWVQEVIEVADEPITAAGLYEVDDVWSMGQTVTLVVGAPGGEAGELRGQLPAIRARLDDQYRRYAQSRMYLSGVDSALADTLATEAGFYVTLPKVYRYLHTDSTFIFRNDNPDPSELIRQIAVTWRSPAPARLDVEDLLAWRATLAAEHYTEPQDFVEEGMSVDDTPIDGHPALEVQSQWRNPPDRGWPAGGPLITRAITCETQDRTYLIDAWLYAPGEEKYEYMIQLETIMDSFRCG